ncbi:hypothetical protein [Listeria phage LMTA-57]|uniref:Uncharacterized protein n=1 Tax=Listeria phage LMTA-57 TaxID=1486414 RepID=A0A068CCX0_9CAUD|nr:hypothetical protein QLX42_gp028 [Listeria phage LMTA-57]AID17482.1 hypothetical protein [Listeria phage LMTA-57]
MNTNMKEKYYRVWKDEVNHISLLETMRGKHKDEDWTIKGETCNFVVQYDKYMACVWAKVSEPNFSSVECVGLEEGEPYILEFLQDMFDEFIRTEEENKKKLIKSVDFKS